MKTQGDSPSTESTPATGSHPTRREMVKALLAGIGAGAAWPLVARAAVLEQVGAQVAAADWAPAVLAAQQNETLVSLAEAIVPGSGKVRVNRFIDLLLSVDTSESREKFVGSLAAIDRESRTRFGHPFEGLADAQQSALLTLASTGDAGQHGGDSQLHDHFENLKGWITETYYSTEAGMRELGWTGSAFFETFPGCPHPDGHR